MTEQLNNMISKVDTLINDAEIQQRMKSMEILNRSEYKLKDMEDETKVFQEESEKLDFQIKQMKQAIRDLGLLLENAQTNKGDLDVAIKANLRAIQVLRENNIKLKE